MAAFNLTDGADNVTGTSRTDTFTGGTNGLQTEDVIDGRGGEDELRSGVIGTAGQAPTIRNVENIFLDTAGLPFSIENITGAETIVADVASTTLTNIEDRDTRIVFGADNVQSGQVKLQFVDGALLGSNSTLGLSATDANVTFTTDSVFDSTDDGEQNETSDALRVERIGLDLQGTSTGTQFQNQVDISDYANLETLILTGSADSKIVVDSDDLSYIRAIDATGDITIAADIAGDVRIGGGSGNDTITTGGGDDFILANDGNDTITAGTGDNLVRGGAGDDTITTEQGEDDIQGGSGNDTINTGSGDDRINGGTGNDEITAGDGADLVFGGEGDDTLNGQGGADTLIDKAGDDTVDGGGDNDRFLVGEGTDTLTGGGGVDTFLWRMSEGADLGTDTVTDFTLTSDTQTNDAVVFTFNGETRYLQSQNSFQSFADEAGGSFMVDDGTSTITIVADNATIILETSDTDFLMT